MRHLRRAGGRPPHTHHRKQLRQLLQEREEEGADPGEKVESNLSFSLQISQGGSGGEEEGGAHHAFRGEPQDGRDGAGPR